MDVADFWNPTRLWSVSNYDEHTAWGHHHKQDQQAAA
jgi:hypothetical protein